MRGAERAGIKKGFCEALRAENNILHGSIHCFSISHFVPRVRARATSPPHTHTLPPFPLALICISDRALGSREPSVEIHGGRAGRQWLGGGFCRRERWVRCCPHLVGLEGTNLRPGVSGQEPAKGTMRRTDGVSQCDWLNVPLDS